MQNTRSLENQRCVKATIKGRFATSIFDLGWNKYEVWEVKCFLPRQTGNP
jgi:hypothetical protein